MPDSPKIPSRPLGKPLTLQDRVRVVAVILDGMQNDIYAGKYGVVGRPNITTIQHIFFEPSEDLDEYRPEMEKILAENAGYDAEVCKVLWKD